jgi:hypothetical protein
VRGREKFARINENYPAHGRWEFTVQRLIADEDEVVSEVGVTDGTVVARLITCSTIRNGKILHDPFEPAAWRA